MRKVIALTAVFLLLLTALPAQAAGTDFTDFGGTPDRQHNNLDPAWGAGGHHWQAAPLGASMSQPLVVGDRLYVLAGNRLWMFDAEKIRKGASLMKTPPDGSESAYLGSIDINGANASYSHPTYSPDNQVLYVGTGRRSVIAVDPKSLKILGDTGDLGADLVSAPLAFPNDTVVFGTRNGYIWIVHGLKAGKPYYVKRHFDGAVTASAVKIDDASFAIATDGPGAVVAYYVKGVALGLQREDFEKRWDPQPLTADKVSLAGIPDSPAIEGDALYFVDKPGTFYKINKDNGSLVWKRSYPQTNGFYNSSPAIGDNYVYFVRRGADDQGNGVGLVVALDKGTGDLAWAVPLSSYSGDPLFLPQGNTSPLYWKAANMVLVGDTVGYVSAWDAATGKPRKWAVARDGKAYSAVSIWSEFDSAWSQLAWSHLQGIGTEITVAGGFAVFGQNTVPLPGWDDPSNVVVNQLSPAKEQLGGTFITLLFPPPMNLILKEGRSAPVRPKPGDSVTVTATALLDTKDTKPVTAPLAWRWKSEAPDAWHVLDPVILQPGQPATVSLTVPAKDDTVVLKINPNEDDPPFETTYLDNTVQVPITMQMANLKLQIRYPPQIPAYTNGVPVFARVIPFGLDAPVTVPLDFSSRVMGYQDRRWVTVQPGKMLVIEYNFDIYGPGTIDWQASVNADRVIDESTWADNSASAETLVTQDTTPNGPVDVQLTE